MSFLYSDVKADGHGEVFVGCTSNAKFKQYGWRYTTKENAFSNKTLIGNWNQERYDLCKLEERKSLPSQYAHYYETTYSDGYCRKNDSVRQVFQKEPHIFPGHQPELNTPPCRRLQ